MDRPTTDFYNRYAADAIQSEAARSALSRYFALAFKPGGRVLDVGAGSGRDLAVLRAMGFDAFGVEPNAAMRAVAVCNHPELAGRVLDGALPQLGVPFGGGFDGVVCSAVLMHVAPADLPPSALALRALLAPGGRLLVSLPFMHPDLLAGERDADGRYFQNHAYEALARHLAAAGLAPAGQWDEGEHAGTRWFVLLFELAAR
ncbi:MAG: methyltransferase domain-containing protein [Burkholderiaceae bacterium]|nr:methyltransferase domain-containing protein [Burkholderiaceae bacterium]